MKRYSLLLMCFIAGCLFKYSFGANYEDFSKLEKLKGRTLLVIVDDSNTAYGKAMISSFKTRWTATPYKVITSKAAVNFMDSDRYAIFAFVITSMIYKGVNETYRDHDGGFSEGGKQVLLTSQVIMEEDSIPIPFRGGQYVSNGNQVTQTNYLFEILLCNKVSKGIRSKLSDLTGCYAQGANAKSDIKQINPVKYCQSQLVPDVLPLICSCNWKAEIVFSGKKVNVKRERLKLATYRDGKRTIVDSRMDIDNYNNGLEKLKGKKIYVDSCIVNDTSIVFLREMLGIGSNDVKIVNKKEIDVVYNNRSANDLIIDYSEVGANQSFVFYSIYTTEGEMLAEFYTDLQNISFGVKYYHISY